MVCENGSYSEIFDEIVKISNEDIFPHTKFKTLFYSLISEISRKYIYDKIYTRELSNIAPTIEYMRSNPLTNMSLPELAEISHISESCFRRLFKKHFNMTPVEYIKEKKINKAKSLIRSNMYAINEVSQLVGYEAPSYFSKVFKKTTGMSPGEYRDRFRL